LAQESGTTRSSILGAGSYFIERLTADLAAKAGTISARSRSSAAWRRLSRQGSPKLRIEEAAARTQAPDRFARADRWSA
jgi:methylmalonyl-CoA mutase